MLIKLNTLLLLSAITLIAALTGGCTLMVTPPPPSAELNPNAVIFTAEQSAAIPDLLFNVLSPKPENTWTPTTEDVASLEADLLAFLQRAEHPWLRPDPPIVQRVPDYFRQYFGIVENGEQIIYANFLCSVDQEDWRNDFVMVMDGGDCYFQLKYDPLRRAFFDFSVNGEA